MRLQNSLQVVQSKLEEREHQVTPPLTPLNPSSPNPTPPNATLPHLTPPHPTPVSL